MNWTGSRVAAVDLALLKRMETAAMTVDAKLRSRVAAVDLARTPEANGNRSDDRGRQTAESNISIRVVLTNIDLYIYLRIFDIMYRYVHKKYMHRKSIIIMNHMID